MPVLSVQQTDSVMTDTFSICVVVLIFFSMEFFGQGPVKVSILIIRSLWTIRDTDCLHICKEGRPEISLVD